MRLLYVGDIMGDLGIKTVSGLLKDIKKDNKVDVVIAQAENVTDGKGISIKDFAELQAIGIDFCTGGNWTLHLDEIHPSLEDENQPIIRPANYLHGTPGKRYKYLKTKHGDILVVSLLGKIVGKDADMLLDNPLDTVDKILLSQEAVPKVATIVNFHGDYSSEKVVIGHYLDGRVSAVVGDHWHVPTADGRILPNGTAHISDVGMCGALNSSLGVKLPVIYKRWKDNIVGRNELETVGPCQFNGVVIEVDEDTGLATKLTQIQKYVD
jgi:2',3'-cyclic-nucleotide 2'-phosphodiesterase